MDLKRKLESNVIGVISTLICAALIGFFHITNQNNVKTEILVERLSQLDTHLSRMLNDIEKIDLRLMNVVESRWSKGDQDDYANRTLKILEVLQDRTESNSHKTATLSVQIESIHRQMIIHEELINDMRMILRKKN